MSKEKTKEKVGTEEKEGKEESVDLYKKYGTLMGPKPDGLVSFLVLPDHKVMQVHQAMHHTEDPIATPLGAPGPTHRHRARGRSAQADVRREMNLMGRGRYVLTF